MINQPSINSSGVGKVQVIFLSSDPQYPIPDTPLFLPIELNKNGLNEICNHVLGLADRPVIFDFLIEKKFLKSSIKNYLSINNLSTETVLEIEVIESTLPPKELSSYLHDDWVSSINLNSSGLILTGCYDKLVRVWDHSNNCLASLKGHSGPIKDVKFVNNDELDVEFLSSSMDQSIIGWKKDGSDNYIPLYTCKGHTKSVESLSISPNGQQFASASCDSTLKIWSLLNLDEDPEHSFIPNNINKKVKQNNNNNNTSFKSSILTLNGHFGPINQVKYGLDSQQIYSGGNDHSIRIWDLLTAINTTTLVSDNSVTSILPIQDRGLIVSGHVDGIIRVWDSRIEGTSSKIKSLIGHKNQITSLIIDPTDPQRLLSSSLDSTIKGWDLRASTYHFDLSHPDESIPSYDSRTIDNTHQVFDNKVFCLDTDGKIIASGGSDSKVKVFGL